MIYIGLSDKETIIKNYIEQHSISFVLVIWSKTIGEPDYHIPVAHEYLEHHQSEMYKNYYRLLQVIDPHSLIVCDEVLVKQNRYDLDYNCVNAFTNQTPHRIIFSRFPFIEDPEDFMILLDYHDKTRYKGKSFDRAYLEEEGVTLNPVHINMSFRPVEITEKDREKYDRKKEDLFDNIGMKDPDTIPRQLAIEAGNIRKQHIDLSAPYTARNQRIKGMTTYKDNELHTIFDLPSTRKELIDLMTRTGHSDLEILTSELSIDRYLRSDYSSWNDRLEAFYR